MSSALKEIENLLGIPSPNLLWREDKEFLGRYHSTYEGFEILIRRLNLNVPDSCYSWDVYRSRRDSKHPTLPADSGISGSMWEAMDRARNCLIGKLS